MRGGSVASPVTLISEEEVAIGLLGATGADVRAALATLDGSLLILVQQKAQYIWRAKHPTVLDAFASLVAESRELMDIYLAGTPVRQLLSEVACGDGSFGGIKVEVPADRYEGLIGRVGAFLGEHRENRDSVDTFLAYRCGTEFLRRFLERNPDFIDQLVVTAFFDAVTSVNVLNKLHAVGLLPEDQRIKHVVAVRELAVQTPDAGFLRRGIVSFLTDAEIEEILGDVREKLLPFIDVEIDVWKDNCSRRESPSGYFEPLRSALSEFATALAHDTEAVALIEKGIAAIDEAIAELDRRASDEPDYDDDYYHRSSRGPSGPDSRSIFDDVDD